MKEYGLVSIITPCYNNAKFIGKAIESVISQTYQNWEMLITDDCSSDGSVEVIMNFINQDSRIKLFRLEKNSGAAVARNKSITEAKGRYIAFLDGDDIWMPNKLEIQLEFMSLNDYALSCTSMMYCDEEGMFKSIELAPQSHSFKQSLKDNRVGTSTAIYDIDKVGKILMPLIRKRQDWALFMTILKTGVVAHGIKQPLCIYRVGQQSLSKNKWSLIKYNVATYQVVLGWSFIRAFLYFLFIYMPCWSYKKWLMRQYNK